MTGTLSPEVVVLGASGTVGAGVVAALLEAGSPVLAVGRDMHRLRELAVRYPDEPGLELQSGSVATERAGAALAVQLAGRVRPLRAVIDATAGPRPRSTRVLDAPAARLRRTLDQELLPHLVAARHLLPLLAGHRDAQFLLVGGPAGERAWSGYGLQSIASAATRMLINVLHEEARPLGVRVQLIGVDAPLQTPENAGQACPGWPRALEVGRCVVKQLINGRRRPGPLVPFLHDCKDPPGQTLFTSLVDPPWNLRGDPLPH